MDSAFLSFRSALGTQGNGRRKQWESETVPGTSPNPDNKAARSVFYVLLPDEETEVWRGEACSEDLALPKERSGFVLAPGKMASVYGLYTLYARIASDLCF